MDTLEPGMRVVCVRATKPGANYAPSHYALPVVGNVYTVREVCRFIFWEDGPAERDAVRLVEIVNPVYRWKTGQVAEVAYGALNFRPLRSRSTDISIFKDIVEKVKRGEPVEILETEDA